MVAFVILLSSVITKENGNENDMYEVILVDKTGEPSRSHKM